MNNPKIWLSGSSGLVGRSIFAKLAAQSVDLLSVTNQHDISYPDAKQSTELISRSRVTVDFSDSSQIESTCEEFGVPDVFIHAGWGAMTNPDSKAHLEENVVNAETLIRTLYGAGLGKFIFIGSIEEYGQRDGKLSESSEPQGTLRNYALGKREVASRGFREAAKRDSIYVHVRLANAYGAPQRNGSLIHTLHSAYQNQEVPQLGPCAIYRDYIHTSDVAEGILRICEIDVSTTVNLGSGKTILLKDFAKQYWDVLGGDGGDLIFGGTSVGGDQAEPPRPYMDLTRFEELTKWRPVVSMREGIELTAAAIIRET